MSFHFISKNPCKYNTDAIMSISLSSHKKLKDKCEKFKDTNGVKVVNWKVTDITMNKWKIKQYTNNDPRKYFTEHKQSSHDTNPTTKPGVNSGVPEE